MKTLQTRENLQTQEESYDIDGGGEWGRKHEKRMRKENIKQKESDRPREWGQTRKREMRDGGRLLLSFVRDRSAHWRPPVIGQMDWCEILHLTFK